MRSRNQTPAELLGFLCTLLVLIAACKDAKRSGSQENNGSAAQSEMDSRYSYQAHLARGKDAFDILTEGHGSLRTMTILHTQSGFADTLKEEIDGAVVNAACADLDRDSIPEIYVFAQSAGSGSYADLYGFQFDQQGIQSITLPELDKRQSAGHLGHDTLWVQDSVLVRMFPVYTEGDINVSASGGTRTLEYVLQRDAHGNPGLHVSRVINKH
jgi:hypothetical protein